MNNLSALQRRFQLAVLEEDEAPGLFVSEGSRVAGGLGLYLEAYRARLVAALRNNFPVLHRALGEEDFADLARGYIKTHPSCFRSIRWFGDSLVEFLEADPERLPHPALVDIARMDWAICGAFDASNALLLSLPELAALPPQEWPSQHFAPVPSLSMVELDFSVEPIWRALNEDAEAQTEAPEPLRHTLLVWRPELDCLWRSAEPIEVAALSSLAKGASFAECCTAIAETGASDPAATAAGLLQRWVVDGMLQNDRGTVGH